MVIVGALNNVTLRIKKMVFNPLTPGVRYRPFLMVFIRKIIDGFRFTSLVNFTQFTMLGLFLSRVFIVKRGLRRPTRKYAIGEILLYWFWLYIKKDFTGTKTSEIIYISSESFSGYRKTAIARAFFSFEIVLI